VDEPAAAASEDNEATAQVIIENSYFSADLN
jgi:hypothetical protein